MELGHDKHEADVNFIQKFLANIFAEKRFQGISQDQNEALMDCLALAVMIDGVADPAEIEEIKKQAEMFNWQGSVSFEAYLDAALEHAESVFVEEQALRVFASDIAERLDEEWLCEEAYYISALIVTSDEDLNEEERAFLNALVESMGISRKRLQDITQKLMDERAF